MWKKSIIYVNHKCMWSYFVSAKSIYTARKRCAMQIDHSSWKKGLVEYSVPCCRFADRCCRYMVTIYGMDVGVALWITVCQREGDNTWQLSYNSVCFYAWNNISWEGKGRWALLLGNFMESDIFFVMPDLWRALRIGRICEYTRVYGLTVEWILLGLDKGSADEYRCNR